MNRLGTLKPKNVISVILSICLWINSQGVNASIAGVTYMDDFDFQERYRDLNECNPFYWHPLHLPEECFRIFDTLIRSRLAFSPYRVFKEKEQTVPVYPYKLINAPIYRTAVFEEIRQPTPSTPLHVLFKLLRRDINDNPIGPSIENSPYFGTIAKYKQPISFKSVAMIKKLAHAYAKAYPILEEKTESHIENLSDKEKDKVNEKI